MVKMTASARAEILKLMREQPGRAVRLFVDGFG